MKLSELRYGEHFQCTIEAYSKQNNKIKLGNDPIGSFGKDDKIADAFMLNFDNNTSMVRVVKCNDLPALEARLSSDIPNLLEISDILKSGQINIELVFFREIKELKDDFVINLSSVLLDKDNASSAIRNGMKARDLEQLGGRLFSEFHLGSSGNPYYLFIGTPATISSFSGNDGLAAAGDFSLVSKSRQLLVKSTVRENEIDKLQSTMLFAVGIKNRTPRNADNSVVILHGKIKFNAKGEEELSRRNALEIESNLKDGSSYIGKWDEYNNEIGKTLLNAGRRIGYAAVSGKIEVLDSHILRLNFSTSDNKGDFSELSADTDHIDIVQELPSYLKNYNLSYEDWIQELDTEIANDENQKTKKEKKELEEANKWKNLKIIELGQDYIDIETRTRTGKSPERGENGELFIILSIESDKVQVKRRRQARQDIVQGKSAISALALILDGEQNVSVALPSVSKSQKTMSAKVKNKIFEYEPTPKQKSAVEKALNSPDIMVIQGPPGTGKTTVICAIIEALNEDFQRGERMAGKILVTSLQHDAVSNINKRLSVNSLPSIKYGKSSKEGEDDAFSLNNTEQKIIDWSYAKADKIEKSSKHVQASLELRKLQELFIAYHASPSKEMEISLLKGIKELPSRFTTPAIVERIDSLLENEEFDGLSSASSDVIRVLYSLRTGEVPFADDGPEHATDLKLVLQDEGIPVPDCLEKAITWENGKNMGFLSELEEFKNELIDQYVPEIEFRHEKENSVVVEIVREVSECIKNHPFDPAEKTSMALADFVYELRNNPDGIMNTLMGYNPVFAATVSQSEGSELKRARKELKLSSETEEIPYEYVIVDEAARVAPPDLLIPLSKAKHIILVGDHRQLPQQVEQDIEKKLEDGAARAEDVAYLKESTFERLFAQLDESKKITLDKQYRMHPLLGNFVSKQFYEPHNEGFESPLKPELFRHNLPRVSDKAAAWIDVPFDEGIGKEGRNAVKSRYRKAEARAAAKLLKEWLDSDRENKMTFGIISFYSAQCTEIKNELKAYGICENNGSISEEYKYTSKSKESENEEDAEFKQEDDREERIRIGTVDAFQGMEFDAVILCTVRSVGERQIENAYNALQRNSEEGLKKKQALFGFLMSKNRLCVSMSRQKKLLAVVGDKNLFTSEIAKDAVPELSAFYDLCKSNSEYGIVLDGNSLI